MIKTFALKHGWFYYYRFHEKRCKHLNNGYEPLKKYLENVGLNCPNEYFTKGPRSSALTFKLKDLKVFSLQGHEISSLAREALKNVESRDAHPAIEMFFLNHDEKTLASEVPLWLETNEMASFKELFKSNSPLTGHIDLLRIEEGKLWIWDYKPNASQELYAATQTFFYAYMLSKRTGLSIENIKCGYFDTNYAFVFNPAQASIVKNNTLINYL